MKSFLAGKRGICPHCGIGVDIPEQSTLASKKKGEASRVAKNGAEPAKAAAGIGAATAVPVQAATARGPAPSPTATTAAVPVMPKPVPVPMPVAKQPAPSPTATTLATQPLSPTNATVNLQQPAFAVPTPAPQPSPAPQPTFAAQPTAAIPAAASVPQNIARPVTQVASPVATHVATPVAMPTPVAATPVAAAPLLADPIAEAPNSVWYVRPPSGGQFGPAKGDIMRKWVTEGRVSADSLVWREGWPDWKPAGPIFPSLSRGTPPAAPAVPAVTPTVSPVVSMPANPLSQPLAKPSPKARSGAPRNSNALALAVVVLLGLISVILIVVFVYVIATGKFLNGSKNNDTSQILRVHAVDHCHVLPHSGGLEFNPGAG